MNRNEKFLTILFILVSGVFFFSVKTYAASVELPDGLLISDNTGMKVSKSGGYFFKLEDLFPGDVITRKLTIENKGDENHDLKMLIEPTGNKGPADLIKNMDMKLTYNQQEIFDGNLVNQDKQVTNRGSEINLGTIKANSKQELDIKLKVKVDVPWENFVKDESHSKTSWTFVATKAKESEKKVPVTVKQLPRTGEKNSILVVVLGLVCCMLGYYLLRKDKKVAK